MSQKSLRSLWSLEGRVALVTGAGRGLGKAIALRLAEAGAAVVVNDIDAEAAQQAAGELRRRGAEAAPAVGDIGDDDDIRAVLATTLDVFGRIDVLVNNAGLVPLRPTLEMSREQWDHLLAVNTRGPVVASELAAEHMIQRGIRGSIINVLSVAAVRALQVDLLAYAVSKAGLRIATEMLARSLAVHGIRVNGLLPTVMQTDSTKAIPDLRVPDVPLGRLPDPDEVARGALFLASDMSEFVTGIVLPVDGGRLIS